MKIFSATDYAQLSPAWYAAKLGIPSTSNFDRIITPGTGKLSKSADKYAAELIAELFCLDHGAMTETPMNAAMRHGVSCEPEARAWYAMERNCEVTIVGGCTTEDGRFWASTDGLVGEDGVLELKCPKGATHAGYLFDGGKLPDEYKPQVHGELLVTGRQWVDFVSYVAGMPRQILVRVERDEYTVKLAKALDEFHVRYLELLELVKGKEGVL